MATGTEKKSGVSAMVIKAMSIFSGVQVINIVCSIVRTKLVALWIGAAGVGLFGLYNNAIEMLNSLFQLGLRNSTIPVLASAANESIFRRVCYVVRRWMWALGIIGAFLTVILSPLLSEITFQSTDHTVGFILLAISIFAAAITNRELAVLQGSKMLARMAKASIWGSVSGLIVSIPLFYLLGINSIIPSLIVYSVATAIAAWCMRRRVPDPDPRPTTREVIHEGAEFVRLGVFMTASAFITLAFSYLFMAWLNGNAGTDTVGFYQAGYTLVNRYVGLVFTAIAMEYFPRLSSARSSGRRLSAYVGHESLIALLVILPVATIFMAMDDFVIRLLYKSDFEVTATYVSWGLAGTAFRAVSWCMAFVILAKGDGKTYLWTESLSAAFSLGLNILLFNQWGLTGLGIAYVLWYAFYTLIVGIVYFGKYRLRINAKVVFLFFATIVITVLCAISRDMGQRLPSIIAAVATSIFSITALRKLLH